MQLLLEGIESLKLACSIILLVPAVGIILTGRRHAPLLTAVWIATVVVVAWARFATWWITPATNPGHLALGLLTAALGVAAWKRPHLGLDIAATIAVAVLATWAWVPCVGRELGSILNEARFEPWGELAPTAVYFIGLFLVLIVAAALPVMVPAINKIIDRETVHRTGLAIVIIVGLLASVTLLDDLAGELARRSSF